MIAPRPPLRGGAVLYAQSAPRRSGWWPRLWTALLLLMALTPPSLLLAAPPRTKNVPTAKPAASKPVWSAEAQTLARLQRTWSGRSTLPQQLADALALARLDGLVPLPELHDTACQALTAAQRKPVAPPLARALLAAVVRRQVSDLRQPCPVLEAELAGEAPAAAWRWLGPLSDGHGSGLGENGVLEQALAAGPDGELPLPAGRDGALGWQAVPSGLTDADGRVVVDELVDRPGDAVVYLQTELVSPTEQPVVLWLWTAGAARLWVGGRELPALAAPVAATGLPDQAIALPANAFRALTLPQGRTRLMVKLAPGGASLAFRLAVRAPDGSPVPRVRAEAPQGAGPASAQLQPLVHAGTAADAEALALQLTGLAWPNEDEGEPPLPTGTPSPLAALLALAWHGWPFGAALQERLLAAEPALVYQDLTTSRQSLAPDAAAAVGLALAHLAGEPGDRLDRVRWWRRDAADHPALQVEETSLSLQMGKAAAAGRLWNSLDPKADLAAQRIDACLVRVELLRRLGLSRPANTQLAQCAARWSEVPLLDAALAAEAEADEALTRAAGLRRAAAARAPGRWSTLAAAMHASLAEGDDDAASRAGAAWCAAWPDRCRSAELLARRALAKRDPSAALQALGQLPRWLWRASSHEIKAQALQALGKRTEAAEALREADRRSPGRPEVAARLALLSASAPPWAPLRRDLIALAKAAAPSPTPLSLALRQTILQGLGNGRQDHYEAEVWVVGRNGPRQHTVQFDYAPSVTRAEVLQALVVRGQQTLRTVQSAVQTVQGDASGMYYEADVQTLTFDDLRPGDRLVVEWRLQDLHPTPFGLVFGELLALGDDVPIAERDIAVLLPGGTALQTSVSLPAGRKWPDVTATPAPTQVTAADGSLWQQWRWQTWRWPAVASESSMPGPTDVLPYLHVSTFASWQAAGQWYARLVADALPQRGVDAVVREQALRLTRGLASDEAKVRAIHAYVARQIRYVGLEFGIHSLKPHAVREVLDRRFGDCKDKATLLVALCREVGIDAQVVLVRTADLGGLHDQTASLGVFNHAIANVPQLGWWLDATAPHHEPEELPTGDHGATVLPVPRLDSSGPLAVAALAPQQLPAAKPDAQEEELELTLTPDPSGDVHLTARVQWRGLMAAEARGLLQNAQTRQTTLQEQLAAQLPGLQINRLEVTGLEPPQPQVVVTFAGVVPHWQEPDGQHHRLAPLRPATSYVQRYLPEPKREHPLVLSHGWTERALVRVVLPPGARWVSGPADVTLQGPDAKASLSREPMDTSAPNTTVLRWQLQMPGRVEVAQLPALRRWLQQVDAALTAPLVFAFAPADKGGTP